MNAWYQRRYALIVGDLIEKIASWVKAGFVSPEVWLDLKQRVRLDVLSDYMETISLEKKQ